MRSLTFDYSSADSGGEQTVRYRTFDLQLRERRVECGEIVIFLPELISVRFAGIDQFAALIDEQPVHRQRFPVFAVDGAGRNDPRSRFSVLVQRTSAVCVDIEIFAVEEKHVELVPAGQTFQQSVDQGDALFSGQRPFSFIKFVLSDYDSGSSWVAVGRPFLNGNVRRKAP